MKFLFNYEDDNIVIEASSKEEGLSKLFDEVWSRYHWGMSVSNNFDKPEEEPVIWLEDADVMDRVQITIEN